MDIYINTYMHTFSSLSPKPFLPHEIKTEKKCWTNKTLSNVGILQNQFYTFLRTCSFVFFHGVNFIIWKKKLFVKKKWEQLGWCYRTRKENFLWTNLILDGDYRMLDGWLAATPPAITFIVIIIIIIITIKPEFTVHTCQRILFLVLPYVAPRPFFSLGGQILHLIFVWGIIILIHFLSTFPLLTWTCTSTKK